MMSIALWAYISLWFGLAQYLKRLDVLDVAWGLGFVYVVVLCLLITGNYNFITILSLILTIVWGFRLSIYIAGRNLKRPEDFRYRMYRDKWKDNFALRAYFRLFLAQAAMILVVSTATIGTITSEQFIVPLASAGLVVWVLGIVYESISDRQLHNFIKRKKSKGAVLDKGLWRYSRHPNYFGEIIVWIGAGLVAASGGAWWGLIGTITITYLIIRVSGVSLVEKRFATNSKYRAYKAKTNMLLPLPPKR